MRPYDVAMHAIGRANGLLDEVPKGSRLTVHADMRRASVVMAVSALDTYMHRLVVANCFGQKTLPKELARLTFTFEQLVMKADEVGIAARMKMHKPRPRVAVKRELRQRLSKVTFQNYDGVSSALSMAGRKKEMSSVAERFQPKLTDDQLRNRLNGIVERRNRIVHEGDYVRLDRPQTARRNPISTRAASADIKFIADLIDAIHNV